MATAPDGRVILELPYGPGSEKPHAHLDLLVDALLAHGNHLRRGWVIDRDGSFIRLKEKIDWELLNRLFVIPDEVVLSEETPRSNAVFCKRTYNTIWGGV